MEHHLYIYLVYWLGLTALYKYVYYYYYYYYVCWPRLTAKRVEPVVSISWASCLLSLSSSDFFLGPVAHHSSFLTPSAGTQFQGELLQWGAKYKWVGKFCERNGLTDRQTDTGWQAVPLIYGQSDSSHNSRGTFATAFAGEHAGREIPSFSSKTADIQHPSKSCPIVPHQLCSVHIAVPDIAGCDLKVE